MTQPLPIGVQMSLRLIRIPKMSQEQSPGTQLRNNLQGRTPQLQGNVRWRRGRKNERMAFDADSRRVTHVSHTLGRIEIGDMVRSVSRRVKHAKFPRSKRQCLASLQNP